MRPFALAPIVLSLVFALACGGSTYNSPPPPPVSISISPATANVSLNQTAQFDANVQGTSITSVTWSVKEDNGGFVTSGGMYRAPWIEGSYHLTATAVADPTKTATATITVTATIKVTAFTAFLEASQGGTSTPLSMTPVLGMLLADGTWQAAPIIDPTTNAPMVTSFSQITITGDGAKVFASQPLSDSGGQVTWNIVKFNSDGTGMTNLTNNVPGPTGDLDPQLSLDGKLVVYTHLTSLGNWEIWKMNADGSNPQILSSNLCPAGFSLCAYSHPSFSPDGSKIVYNYAEVLSICCAYLGIASTNADGTGTENYLTGCRVLGPPPCNLDDMPTFTNDGNNVSFTRSGSQYTSRSLYIMNADGSNVVPLYETDTTAFQPRPFADRILFSSNVDNPGTNNFEIYSIMPDGSNVTRLTNNSVYDGFDTSWINYPTLTTPAESERRGESR